MLSPLHRYMLCVALFFFLYVQAQTQPQLSPEELANLYQNMATYLSSAPNAAKVAQSFQNLAQQVIATQGNSALSPASIVDQLDITALAPHLASVQPAGGAIVPANKIAGIEGPATTPIDAIDEPSNAPTQPAIDTQHAPSNSVEFSAVPVVQSEVEPSFKNTPLSNEQAKAAPADSPVAVAAGVPASVAAAAPAPPANPHVENTSNSHKDAASPAVESIVQGTSSVESHVVAEPIVPVTTIQVSGSFSTSTPSVTTSAIPETSVISETSIVSVTFSSTATTRTSSTMAYSSSLPMTRSATSTATETIPFISAAAHSNTCSLASLIIASVAMVFIYF